MILLHFGDKPRIDFKKGYEFNDVTRPKFWYLRLLWLTIMYFDENSDIMRVFNKAHMTKDFNWVEDVQEYKKQVKEQAQKEAHENYLKENDILLQQFESVKKELQEYKEAVEPFKNLVYSCRSVYKKDMETLEKLL